MQWATHLCPQAGLLSFLRVPWPFIARCTGQVVFRCRGQSCPCAGTATLPNLSASVPAQLPTFLVDLWASVFPFHGGVAALFGDGATGPAGRSVSPLGEFGSASVSVLASFPIVSLHWESGVLENEHVNFLRETLGK